MSDTMVLASPEHPATSAKTSGDFARLAEPLRRELKLHCYRMLGSVHEAEDLVQETYLRAWRGFAGLEGAARPWLYRIATNACLDALKRRRAMRKLMPEQLAPAAGSIQLPPRPATEIAWLEPYPDAEIDHVADAAPNPEAHYAAREAVQLAFVAAIQQLPPRQRAVLLLCDVLGWSATASAELLEGSVASVNSALQRARDTLAKTYHAEARAAASEPTPAQRRLLERYLHAWEGHDLDGFVALLKEDATYTMPPWLQWFVGRPTIRTFFAAAWASCGGLRLVPTAANGQPAFAVYERNGPEPRWLPHSLHVLGLEGDNIARLTTFLDVPGTRLFETFGLPAVLTGKI